MEQIILNAKPREIIGKKVKTLRENGEIPAILYGRDFKNISLTLNEKEFGKIFDQTGSSSIVTIKIEGGENIKVLIHEPQVDPVTGRAIHVDLYKVNMKEEIRTEIPLVLVGVAPAVDELEGSLVTLKDAIEIECMPDKLVPEIEIDITSLKTFDDVIKVSDLAIPEGIKVLTDPEETLVQVAAPRSEEEMESLEEETNAAQEEQAQIANIEADAAKEKAEKEEAEEAKE